MAPREVEVLQAVCRSGELAQHGRGAGEVGVEGVRVEGGGGEGDGVCGGEGGGGVREVGGAAVGVEGGSGPGGEGEGG